MLPLSVLSVLTWCLLIGFAEENAQRNVVVEMLSPKNGETVYLPHPHFCCLPPTTVHELYQKPLTLI